MPRPVPVLLAALVLSRPAAAAGNVDLPRYPSISPDGSAVVFTWRGDLWKVPAGGGVAARLTANPADEVHSVWSPDGATIAFSSTRDGAVGVHVMDPDGGNIRHLTAVDQACIPVGFDENAAGEAMVTLHAALEGDVYREFRPYRVATEGGDLERIHDAFGAHPRVSPDGAKVAFDRGGYYDRFLSRRHYRGPEASDVWIYDRRQDTFTRLTTWDGNDRHAKWIDDRTLLFLSDRELDCVNLYRMDASRGEAGAQRLTSFSERDVQHFDVTPDGERVVLAVWDTLYTLDPRTGAAPRPMSISASEDDRDAYEMLDIDKKVTEAALSPDGKVMALVAYGEIYVRNVKKGSVARRVTDSHAREKDIAWSPDGLALYFTSDRDGTESIYTARVETTRGEIKEAFLEATGQAAPDDDGEGDDGDDDDEGGDDEGDAGDEDADEEGDGDSGAGEDEDDTPPLPKALRAERWHDATRFAVAPLVQRAGSDRMPSPSPDGTRLAFRGTRGDVHVLDLETGAITTLLEWWDAETAWRWSPDGRHIAYAHSDLDFNTDIFIVPADGSAAPVNVTRHPNNDVEPRFSADGRILSFRSERVNDAFDVWMVFLDADLEAMTEQELAAYFEEGTKAAAERKPLPVKNPAADDDDEADDDDKDDENDQDDQDDDPGEKPPVEWRLDDAYLRLRRVTNLEGGETDHAIMPSGERIVFASSADEPGLYSIKWDGTDRKRLGDAARVEHLSLTGDKVVTVRDGQAHTVPTGEGETETIAIDARIRVDLAEQSSQKFLEAARGLGEGYYHPTMNGVNWSDATAAYHDLARRARTAEEFDWVANRFIGELNGSHLRIVAPATEPPNAEAYGRLGTTHRRVANGFEVTEVVTHGPADQGPMALRPGDVIRAIQDEPIGPRDTIEARLRGRVGRETVISITRETRDLDVLITPIGYNDERQLRYLDWRRENARLAAEWSNGRIGYIHIQGMNQPALDVFERDLFAAANGKDGLIIDVRNNGGGWTADRVLASIMVREHAYTIPRGGDPSARGHYPQPRLFIQRYTQPVNMLCNEKSYSNAEIVSHAFKTLGRGTLVGQQTHGSVISTGGWALIDGTWVRLPFRGWYVTNDTDMELNGAIPDLLVPQTPEAEARGEDEQLRAAVDDLMERLP